MFALAKDVESAVVLRIFEMGRDRLSLMSIARKLNSKGVPSKCCGKSCPATVRYILDNPKYDGWSECDFRWEEEDIFSRKDPIPRFFQRRRRLVHFDLVLRSRFA